MSLVNRVCDLLMLGYLNCGGVFSAFGDGQSFECIDGVFDHF